jgi:hypothetical protein
MNSNRSDLNAAVAAANAVLTDPELTAEARVGRMLNDIAWMPYPNEARKQAAAGEVRAYAKVIAECRVRGDLRTMIEEGVKLHVRCKTEIAKPIPLPTPEERFAGIWRSLNDLEWASSEIDMLVAMLKPTGEFVKDYSKTEVRTTTDRVITRQAVRDSGRPAYVDPEVWAKNFGQISDPAGPLAHRKHE